MLSCPPAPLQAHNLHRITADSLDTTRRRPSRPHSHFDVQKSRYKSRLGSVHARLHTFRAVTGRWACLRRPRPACAFLRARSSDAGSQARAVLRGGPRRQASVLISVFLEPVTHCTVLNGSAQSCRRVRSERSEGGVGDGGLEHEGEAHGGNSATAIS